MTIKEALIWATRTLNKKKIQSPALDAEILLAFAIKKSKEYLFTYSEKKLTNLQLKTYKLYINRRARREPIAYITGHKEFFGLNFVVNKNVLIPRPETEILVEEALQYAISQKPSAIIDIGTGSGAIIVSLAKNLRTDKLKNLKTNFYAIDTSPKALKIAELNAKRNLKNPLYPPPSTRLRTGLTRGQNEITFLHGNLLSPFSKKSKIFDHQSLIILANLPYLTIKEWRNTPPEIKKYEPRLALDGGPNGLKYFRELFRQINLCEFVKHSRVFVFLEIGHKQAEAVKKLAKQYLPEYEVKIKKDLAGFDRLAIIQKE